MPQGMYLVKPHAQLIWNGKKRLIVKSKAFLNMTHIPLVLVDKDFMWGIISLETPHRMDLKQFSKLRDRHLISDMERVNWWPEKTELFGFAFGFKKFKKPIPWNAPRGTQTFVRNVPLPKNKERMLMSTRMIQDVRSYDPRKLDDDVLLDDHRIAHAWAVMAKSHKTFKHPFELIKKLHDAIVKEMERRKMQHRTPLTQFLARVIPSNNGTMGEIHIDELMENLQDIRLQAPAAWIVGGLANHGSTQGDIDILIRAPAPTEDYDPSLPLRFRILRQFPMELWDRVQFLFNEHSGPFTNHVPLYDLVAMRCEPDVIFMSEELQAKIRIRDEATKRMAAQSKKEDKVKLFRFFLQLKARREGYRKSEEFSIPGVLEALTEKDYPVYTDQKFDGFRVQIHKQGDKIILWSEDGGRVDQQFPTLVKELKTITSPPSFILDAEMELWVPKDSPYAVQGRPFVKGLQHLGRADTSGYAHTKKVDDRDKYLRANVFDIVYIDGKDIHNESQAERRKHLATVPDTHQLQKVAYRIAKNQKEVANAIRFFSKPVYSEGAMIKPGPDRYPLDGTGKFIKFKKEVDMDAQVVQKTAKKGKAKAWVYTCAIRNPAGGLVPVGKTFATGIDVPVGGIIRVTFTTISRYRDPQSGKTWYNWWAPRPLEHREDLKRPDSTDLANKLVRETKGELGDKPLPKHFKQLNLQENPYLLYPDEKDVHRFVIQHHHRGASVHKDLRLELNDELIGWTIADQVKAKVPDVDTLQEAKDVGKHWDDPKWFKFTPVFKGLHVFTAKKATEPKAWLTVEGVVKPGDVGATRYQEGVFYTLDKGTVEWGAQKPHFHEYFLHGKKFKGRLVVRQLPKTERFRKIGREKLWWSSWMAKDQEPYVISRRAEKEGWIPPEGVSALPFIIRKLIPKELQYWKFANQNKRKEVRTLLRKAIKRGDVKLSTVPFSLTHKTQEGPKVVRAGPSVEEWEIMINAHKKGLIYFILDENPLFNEQISALLKPRDDKKWLDFQGEIKPGKPGFPEGVTERVKVFVDQLDKGNVVVLEDSPTFKKFDFRGQKLKGLWTAKKERGTEIWTLKRSGTPQTLSYSVPLNQENFEMTKDGLLIKDVCWLGIGAWFGGGMENAIWHGPEYIQALHDLMDDEIPLCSEHQCYNGDQLDPTKVFGKAFNKRLVEGDLMGDVLVTNKDEIEKCVNNHYRGVSINVDCYICPERRIATMPVKAKELSLCVTPACKVCFMPNQSCPT